CGLPWDADVTATAVSKEAAQLAQKNGSDFLVAGPKTKKPHRGASGVTHPAQVLERGDGCGDTWHNEWLTRTANSISENTTDTFQQLAENKNLAALLACYCIGLVLYNVTGAQVANVMGVMSRTKLEVVRTGLCWRFRVTSHGALEQRCGRLFAFRKRKSCAQFRVRVPKSALGIFKLRRRRRRRRRHRRERLRVQVRVCDSRNET
ncbi:hypothetical protein N8152_02400, partial [bacterium]|nr:hypothetical protein [bacterium]